jgi:hypothetical protein
MAGHGRWIAVLAAAVALTAAAGCGGGQPKAAIRYMTGGPDEAVRYDMAIFQMARGEKIQVLLFSRVAAPVGEADPDFELVLLELPYRSRYGWVKEDDVSAYRWVRQNNRDRLWRAASGQAGMSGIDDSTHIHLDFQTTLEPMPGTPGGPYVFSGKIQCNEDIVQAQGLMNRYGEWLLTLVGKKPKDPPKPAAKPPSAATPRKKSKSPF